MPEPILLRQLLIDNLRPTLSGPRNLLRLELPPAAAAVLGRQVLRPASVLIPLLDVESGIEVLFTQRSPELRVHAGQISFPGGSRDDTDRDPVETALREAEEEIGLPRDRVRVLGMLDDYPTGTGYRVTPVVGLVPPDAPVRADGIEATALLTVPLLYLLDTRNYRAGSFIREGIELPFLEIFWEEHRIWGATAGMLHNLATRLS